MKLILFDLDGTLVDSLQDLANSCNFALSQNHLPTHPLADYRYLVGQGVNRLLSDAAPDDARDAETQTKLQRAFHEYYHKHFADHTRPYPGIPALLHALQKNGYRLGLLSNKPDAFVHVIVKTLALDTYLDLWQGQLEPFPRKPNPTAALHLMHQLNATPHDTYYIGDSDVDILTAKNAQFHSVGVSWGFRGRAELEQSGADRVVDTPEQLLALFPPQNNSI